MLSTVAIHKSFPEWELKKLIIIFPMGQLVMLTLQAEP